MNFYTEILLRTGIAWLTCNEKDEYVNLIKKMYLPFPIRRNQPFQKPFRCYEKILAKSLYYEKSVTKFWKRLKSRWDVKIMKWFMLLWVQEHRIKTMYQGFAFVINSKLFITCNKFCNTPNRGVIKFYWIPREMYVICVT